MNEVHAGPEDYKQMAERCFELANELSSAPTVGDALRALAMDYLMRAAKLTRSEKRRPAVLEGTAGLKVHHQPRGSSII
jgi:hypothetical protein